MHSVVARFPDREFEIHRRLAADETFRMVCADFEEAVAALRKWRGAGSARANYAEEYAQLVEELAAEIVMRLDPAPPPAPSPHGGQDHEAAGRR